MNCALVRGKKKKYDTIYSLMRFGMISSKSRSLANLGAAPWTGAQTNDSSVNLPPIRGLISVIRKFVVSWGFRR